MIIVVPAIRGHKNRAHTHSCVVVAGRPAAVRVRRRRERAKKKTDVNGPTAGAETRSCDLRGPPNPTHSSHRKLPCYVPP